ncbi:MAG: hypothetical protein AB1489_12470 [Acidobacteriota bacterium]
MNTLAIDIVARILARQRRRAIPIRATSALSPDPEPVFGIAPIQVVAEHRVQAIAYGLLSSQPRIVISENPLSREVSCLEPFARDLNSYLMTALREGRMPRIWLPHAQALKSIELLGHRYRYNKQASELIRRMGWQCWELAQESTFESQQVVAVATQIFAKHFVTGQSPVEDMHLGAFLAWLCPTIGVDLVQESERRALQPAAAMLERADDDRIESLRKVVKTEGVSPRSQAAKREIETILTRAARNEWSLLVEAQNAYWNSGLSTDRNYEPLIAESNYRIRISLEKDFRSPSRPHSLSRRLASYEHAVEIAEDMDIRADERIRERERRVGRVFNSTVVSIAQPKRNCKPCKITLRTTQDVLRVRPGTEVSTIDGSVTGKVLSIEEDVDAQLIEIDVKTGVRASTLPTIGNSVEWTTTSVFSPWVRNKVFTYLAESTSPLIFGDALPASCPNGAEEMDLLEIAENLRRQS